MPTKKQDQEPAQPPAPESTVEPETEAEFKADPEPEPKVEAEPETVPEPTPEPEAEATPETETVSEPAPEPEAEAAPEAETAPMPEAEPKVEPAPEPKAEPVSEPKAEPVSEPKIEPLPERRSRRPLAAAAAVIAAAAIAGAGLGAALTAALSSDATATTTVVETVAGGTAAPAIASGDDLGVSEVYRAVADGVVEIDVTGGGTADPSPFGQEDEPQTRGQGSGFVYDDQGRIVTNHHVVDGATSIRVRLADGSTYDARLIGSDASTDLALIEIDAPAEALSPVPLGDSAALEVGEEVVAIGSPFGLQDTVTAGIVSALDRRITAPNGFAIPNAIQTDAAINQGNSGGPLLNRRAEVVGVNSQIETRTGGNVGIGFAVPSSTVESVVAQLLETGSVEHAYLGVSIETVPENVAAELGEAAGAAVAEVREGSPAATAGISAATGTRTLDGVPYPTGGDVITQVDGEAVASAEELQNAIAAKRPGDTVTLTVVRAGQTRTVEVTLGARPS